MNSIIIKALIFLITITLGIICVFGVIGNQKAQQGTFKFLVSITRRTDDKHLCGGNIIDREWIITTARCVYNAMAKPRKLYIRAGTDTLSRPLATYNISAIVPHENFNETEFTDNIALVKIEGFFDFNEHVAPVRPGRVKVGNRYPIAGWGGLNGPSDSLHVIRLKVIDPNVCKAKSKNVFDGSPGQFCVMALRNKTTCDGDLGSPLMDDKKLAGMYSYRVVTDCETRAPQVFTEVSYYRKWISETKKSCFCD